MRILITGASGFLGGRLAKALAKDTKNEVIATSRSNRREEEMKASGVDFISGNPMNNIFLESLLQNVDAVVHCAALSSPWGKKEEFYQANVVLTQQVVDLAEANNVQKFINISSPSIYFNFQDRLNVKETEPMPRRFVNEYAATKYVAENYVHSKNGKKLKTLSLRPRAIIGAEDTVLFPRLMRAYKEGKLRIIGNGKNKADFTAVFNLIEAIKCSLIAPSSAFGRAYNITNGEPVLLWEEVNFMLKKLGEKPLEKKIPYPIVATIARLSEWRSRMTNGKEPALVHYGVASLAKSVTLDITDAKMNLNYKPIQTTRDAINEFINWKSKSEGDKKKLF